MQNHVFICVLFGMFLPQVVVQLNLLLSTLFLSLKKRAERCFLEI